MEISWGRDEVDEGREKRKKDRELKDLIERLEAQRRMEEFYERMKVQSLERKKENEELERQRQVESEAGKNENIFEGEVNKREESTCLMSEQKIEDEKEEADQKDQEEIVKGDEEIKEPLDDQNQEDRERELQEGDKRELEQEEEVDNRSQEINEFTEKLGITEISQEELNILRGEVEEIIIVSRDEIDQEIAEKKLEEIGDEHKEAKQEKELDSKKQEFKETVENLGITEISQEELNRLRVGEVLDEKLETEELSISEDTERNEEKGWISDEENDDNNEENFTFEKNIEESIQLENREGDDVKERAVLREEKIDFELTKPREINKSEALLEKELETIEDLKLEETLLPLPKVLKYMEQVGGIRIRSETVRNLFKEHVENHGLSQTARNWEINRVTLKGYLEGRSMPLELTHKLLSYTELAQLTDVQYCAGRGGPTNYVNLPMELTRDLAYLIGALRDGYIGITQNKDYLVSYIGKDKEWLENINQKFQDTFGIALKLRPDSRGNCYYIERSSKPILHFIAHIFNHPIGKQKDWEFPSIFTKTLEGNKWAHIAGIVDAEGHIRRPHESSRSTTISQTNEPFINLLQKELMSLDVETSKYPDKRRENALFLRTLANSRITFLTNYIKYSQHPEKKDKAKKLLKALIKES